MKRKIFTVLIFSLLHALYAGDSAVFVDEGFSQDGKVYVFGQYGVTDKNFQGWAELYAVDTEKNDYIDGEYFRIKPTSVTKNKKGKDLYSDLIGKSYFELKKYNLKNARPDKVLYIRESENKSSTDEILFKDFVSSVSNDQAFYSVKLFPSVKGDGVNVSSSFYIDLVKKDSEGNILARQKIGNPQITRKGVKSYKIERILSSQDGKSIVFIIEKTCEDKTGVNIRFMVETAKLNSDFFTNLAENQKDEKLEIVEESESENNAEIILTIEENKADSSVDSVVDAK